MTSFKRTGSSMIAAGLLALVFVAGTAAGVVGDRILGPRPTLRTRLRADMAGVLDKLALTPDQRVRAEAIVARSAPRTEVVMREAGERLGAIADSVDQELRALLTPEQRQRLDLLRREPMIMLKRKAVGPGGATKIDTLYPRPPDSSARQ